MKTIEIDGVMETVWRCRALVSIRTAGVYPLCGGSTAEWLRMELSGDRPVPRDYSLELLLTEEVVVCGTDEATDVAEVVAMDTVAGTVKLKSGAVVPARISRREHLGGEARVVREERLIEGLCRAKDAKDTKVGRKKARKKGMEICEVCGWGHDAGFARIEIPGRAVILLHGLMAQVVALVHAAQASGAGAVSTKDERLLKICGGYRHPCKVFDDLKRGADYKVLFDTSRRGVVGLRINTEARKTQRGTAKE